MKNRKSGYRFLKCIGFSAALSVCLAGCAKDSAETMKELSIENNISYNYVLSSALSTATGFAAELGVIPAGEANDFSEEIQAEAALLVDITDGTVLFQKNAHEQLYPASTTKVLTGIVALENGDMSQIAAIDDSIYFNEDNVWVCDFRIGDTITLEQALCGAVINSGNDAASIVATTVSGSIPAFAELMNEKALEIGATNSHFANPHGLTNPDHYVTAYDMYLLFNNAIKIPEFYRISSTVNYKTSFKRGSYTINKDWTNGNQFINGAVTAPKGMKVLCGKTGYTEAAGYCLVIMSENPKNEHRYISVILKSKSRDSMYRQMSYLLDIAAES